jgi:aldehyde dehydrogenase (NAD+)
MIPANLHKFYIGGAWVDPLGSADDGRGKPRDRGDRGPVALGTAADADRAVAAARAAFAGFCDWPVAERIALLERILAEYNRRYDAFAEAMQP